MARLKGLSSEYHYILAQKDQRSNVQSSVLNPCTGKLITRISEGTPEDVNIAVKAAQHAFATTWGLKASGAVRGALIHKLAQLIEDNADAIAAIEALDNGKTAHFAKAVDVTSVLACLRYFAGWADKIQGKTIETSEESLAYTRHEPIGVVGQIIPWNYPGACPARSLRCICHPRSINGH